LLASDADVGHDGGNPALTKCGANGLARPSFKPTRKTATRTTVTLDF